MSETQGDPFEDAAGPVATEADPFADDAPPEETTLGEQEGASAGLESGEGADIDIHAPVDPPAPASAIDPDIPLVDREGQPAAPADEQPDVPNQGDTAAHDAATEAPAPEEAPPTPEPQTAPDGGQQPPQAPPAAPPATEGQPEAAAASEAASGGEQGGEAQDSKNVMRFYHVMYQTAANQWTDLELNEGMEHVVLLDGEPWLRARSADHARRIAWPLLGRPEQGVTVVAVAKGGWAPKRIKSKTVPAREALEIS